MRFLKCLLVTLSLVSVSLASAQSDKVLLKVSGEITNFNSANKKSFDFNLAALQKLGNQNVAAATKYVKGKAEFQGPYLRDVLTAAGISPKAKEVIFETTDNYTVRAPIADAMKYRVIVAHSLNGELLSPTEKGPLWIIYPLDEAPAGMDMITAIDKMAWNLKRIKVR